MNNDPGCGQPAAHKLAHLSRHRAKYQYIDGIYNSTDYKQRQHYSRGPGEWNKLMGNADRYQKISNLIQHIPPVPFSSKGSLPY